MIMQAVKTLINLHTQSDKGFQSFCLCWGFIAQSTQWGHVEHGQFT